MFPHGDGWYSPSFSFSFRLFSIRGGSRFFRWLYSACWLFCCILKNQIQSSPPQKLLPCSCDLPRHYNFCRVHQTLRVTPAMEAGLTDHVWSVEELVGLLE